GDDQFIRGLFCWGFGPLDVTDLRLGDTPLDSFKDVAMEHRAGLVDDEPITLYPQQVLEESVGAELRRDRPRDSLGEIIEGPAELAPIIRVTAGDSAETCLIFAFPAGLVEFKDSEARDLSVEVRLRVRLAGTEPWSAPEFLNFTAHRREG